MTHLIRTDSSNKDFIDLVKLLDADLAIRDGDKHDFYDRYNSIENLRHVVLAYEDEKAVACGAIKAYDRVCVEIKRMYTPPEHRGKGLASSILSELEAWAREEGNERCILETGIKMPEAIGLYLKSGYKIIPNYGQYIDASDSRCFEKYLS